MTAMTIAPARAGSGAIARLVSGIVGEVAKYRAYRRTLKELRALSIDGLLDLDLYRGDLNRVARMAVYGN
ncbi:MAG: hypothetical protein AAGE76_14690 [Pseudomonadota bacterium]